MAPREKTFYYKDVPGAPFVTHFQSFFIFYSFQTRQKRPAPGLRRGAGWFFGGGAQPFSWA